VGCAGRGAPGCRARPARVGGGRRREKGPPVRGGPAVAAGWSRPGPTSAGRAVAVGGRCRARPEAAGGTTSCHGGCAAPTRPAGLGGRAHRRAGASSLPGALAVGPARSGGARGRRPRNPCTGSGCSPVRTRRNRKTRRGAVSAIRPGFTGRMVGRGQRIRTAQPGWRLCRAVPPHHRGAAKPLRPCRPIRSGGTVARRPGPVNCRPEIGNGEPDQVSGSGGGSAGGQFGRVGSRVVAGVNPGSGRGPVPGGRPGS